MAPTTVSDAAVLAGGEGLTLAQGIARKLRSDVLTGRHRPGARVRLEDLKSSFGVSWSPIREAVTRLVGEGLIVADSQKSYRIAPVSRAELAEAIELRVMLETRALRAAIQRGGDTWEVDVLTAHHRLAKLESRRVSGEETEQWEDWHGAFHTALTQACESPILLQFCQQLNVIHDRYRRIFFSRHDVDRDVASEHRQITEATLARDADLACRLLADHVERTGRNILATMPA
jgi:GntR family transcriptional regulator, carbon starvation induced regulator